MRRLIAALLAVAPCSAAPAQPAGIRVEHAWSRAAMAGRSGVVYLAVTDAGAPDRLIGVASPVAASAGLHRSVERNGVAAMRPVASIPVAPGQPVMLTPGGYHIMLMDLKQPLRPGERFPLMLRFDRAGVVTTTVVVARAGATGDGGGSTMPGMRMDDSSVDHHCATSSSSRRERPSRRVSGSV